jgi:uncharacterized protein DUF4190/uncharacterized protein DUF4339/tetratricopeptide repeat protein
MVHVNRGATSLGAFSEEEVREGLRSGRFVSSDIGWCEGMASWKPLGDFPPLAGPMHAAPPPPASAVSSPSVAAQTEPLAIISLALGSAALIGSVLSGTAGLICGHSALSRIRKKADLRGRGLARAGLITGYIAVVLGVVYWILLFQADAFIGGAIIRVSASTIVILGFFAFAIWMAFTRRTWGWIVTAAGFCLALWIEGALGRRDAEAPGALVLVCMFVGFTVTAVVRAFRRRTRQWIMLAVLPFLFIALGLCEGGILVLIYTLTHPKPAHSGLTSLTTFGQASNIDVTKDPDVIKGIQALLRKDGSTAVEAFTNASRKFARNDVIFLGLGRGYGMLRDNDRARQNYERAVALNPRNAEAWTYLGATLNEREPSKAVEACKKATELQPGNATAWFILGLTYESQKIFRSRYLP